MTWIIERGHDRETVLEMDVMSFGSLHESCIRLSAKAKIETSWTAMIAAQGEPKHMKEHLKAWTTVLQSFGIKTKKSAKDFVAKFKKGI